MNGRMYDPALGRFLSPDPALQFADNSQNYNRYSYVLNNPLVYNDPSGYFLNVIIQIGVTLGKALLAGGINYGLQITSNMINYGMTFSQAAAASTFTIGFSFTPQWGMGRQQNINAGMFENPNTYDRYMMGKQNYYAGQIYAQDKPKNNRVSDAVDFSWTFNMYDDWRYGRGAEVRTYSNNNITQALQNTWQVSNARFNFYNKYYGNTNLKGAYYTNYSGKFGLPGLMYAGFNPVMQFVGSSTISIWSNGKTVRFSVWNNTSNASFTNRFLNDHFRSEHAPKGNMYQYYTWDELINWDSYGRSNTPIGDFSGTNMKK